MKRIPIKPRRILVTCPQRLGDVLLTTALVHTLKQAWPSAAIDMLVFRGTESVLVGNPDIDQVIVQAPRAGLGQRLKEIARLWRRYDLAVAVLPTDRSRLAAWLGGRYRVGFLTEREPQKAWLLDQHLLFDDLDTHTIAMQARLASLLGVQPVAQVMPPQASAEARSSLAGRLAPLQRPIAVLHPCPKFRYKMWPQPAWVELALWLQGQGLDIVFSGSGDPDELAYVNAIAQQLPSHCLNLAGQLSLADSAELLKRAVLYIGPDTVMTHMAAATGLPTIALFGPSNPVKWGPWPAQWPIAEAPWKRVGSARRGNVFLIQGVADCVPCMLEGCERHINSASECLETLAATRVIAAAEMFLAERPTQA